MNPMLVNLNTQFASSNPCKEMLTQVRSMLPELVRSRIANEGKLILVGDFGWWNDYRTSFRSEHWHGAPCHHSVAFMDGHVDYLEIKRGMHVSKAYHVLPFAKLFGAAWECQEERSCE